VISRRTGSVIAVLVAATVAPGALLIGWRAHDRKPAVAAPPATAATVRVTRADLSTHNGESGTVGFAAAHTLKNLGSGRVTWLPPVGATVRRGKQLLRVDDRPVLLAYGSTPLFRRLDRVGLVGADVKMLRDNLSALGYATGSQPAVGTVLHPPVDGAADGPVAAPGTKDTGRTKSGAPRPSGGPSGSAAGDRPAVILRAGDAELTAPVMRAVKNWQLGVGLPATGVMEPTDLVVEPHEVRVSGVSARVGDAGDGDVLTIASTERVISVSLDAAAVTGIRAGQKVTVTMPDSRTTTGTVRAVSQPQADTSDDQGGDGKVTVTVTPADSGALKGVDGATVQVGFTDETRKGVLSVPVGALLALREGGYGLQLPDGRLIAVRTGLFAGGAVEVTSPDVHEGMTVVTAS
jgi:hypothetical protein